MQEDILFQISNKLKEVRKSKGVTLQEIADEAGVTKSLVSQIENSRTIPSLVRREVAAHRHRARRMRRPPNLARRLLREGRRMSASCSPKAAGARRKPNPTR